VAGIIGEVLDQDAEGLDVVLAGPMAEANGLSQVIAKELGLSMKHMRFHLCGGIGSSECHAEVPGDSGRPRSGARTPAGWIHASCWRIRNVEDITEPWLKGHFTFELVRLTDGRMVRLHRRVSRPASAKPRAKATADREHEVSETPSGGDGSTVEFMGVRMQPAEPGRGVTPPPPLAKGATGKPMDRVRRLGSDLLARHDGDDFSHGRAGEELVATGGVEPGLGEMAADHLAAGRPLTRDFPPAWPWPGGMGGAAPLPHQAVDRGSRDDETLTGSDKPETPRSWRESS